MFQTFVSQQDRTVLGRERVELFYRNERSEDELWNMLENLRENIFDNEGQFISLDLAEPQTESLPEIFYTALKNARWEHSLQFSLPAILRHNPHIASLFINRAILWQQLCDLLILDDEPNRETVLVLENIDQASPVVQHETARLIRFHETYSIYRTFVFTLDRHSHSQIIPELRHLLDIQ